MQELLKDTRATSKDGAFLGPRSAWAGFPLDVGEEAGPAPRPAPATEGRRRLVLRALATAGKVAMAAFSCFGPSTNCRQCGASVGQCVEVRSPGPMGFVPLDYRCRGCGHCWQEFLPDPWNQ